MKPTSPGNRTGNGPKDSAASQLPPAHSAPFHRFLAAAFFFGAAFDFGPAFNFDFGAAFDFFGFLAMNAEAAAASSVSDSDS